MIKTRSINIWSSLAPSDPGSTLQTLWQVDAALVSLGFPFLLLLIQFSHDDGVKAARSSDVLAQETFVRPALEFAAGGLAAITIIAAWLASDSAVVVAVSILLVSLGLLVWCYFRAIGLLLDRPKMRRLSSEVLRERLKDSMKELWAIQAGNRLLLERLKSAGARSGYVPIVATAEDWWVLLAPATGLVVDIQADDLARTIEDLPRSSGLQAASETTLRTSQKHSEKLDDRVRLHYLCGDNVSEGEPVLSLRRSAFALSVTPTIPLTRIIRIESTSSPADRFRLELSILRDQVHRSIRGNELGDLNDGLDLYRDLVITILDTFHLYERATAGTTATAEPSYGREMLWLQDDIQSAMRVAVSEPRVNSTRAVLDLLRRVTTEALNRGELPAFKSFLGTYRSAWHEAKNEGPEPDWPQLRDTILRTLEAFGSYYVGPRLGSAVSEPDAVPLAAQILAELAQLMKAAVDKGDAEDLRRAALALDRTMRHSINGANRNLEGTEASSDQLSAGERLLVSKAAIFLAIEAWILLRHDSAVATTAEASELLRAIAGLPSDVQLPGLLRWYGYLTAVGIDEPLATEPDGLAMRELLAWSWWETQLWGEEQAGFLRYDSFLEKAFARQLADARAWVPSVPQPAQALSHHADLLLQHLVALTTDESNPPLSGHRQVENIARAEVQLRAIRQAVSDAEDAELIDQPLEAERLDRFRAALVDGWEDPVHLRTLCHQMLWTPREPDSSTDRDDGGDEDGSKTEPRSFGSNILVPKDYFVTRAHVHADPVELGKDYGESLGRSEDQQILALLKDRLTVVRTQADQLGAVLETAVGDLRGRRLSPSLYVFNPWPLMGTLRDLGLDPGADWRSTSGQGAPRLPGSDLPVVLQHAQGESLCILIDFRATIGFYYSLVEQSRTIDRTEHDRIEADGRILVGVDPVTEPLALELLERNPRLRADGQREMSEDEAVRELRKQSRMRVFEWIAIETIDTNGGIVINVGDDS